MLRSVLLNRFSVVPSGTALLFKERLNGSSRFGGVVVHPHSSAGMCQALRSHLSATTPWLRKKKGGDEKVGRKSATARPKPTPGTELRHNFSSEPLTFPPAEEDAPDCLDIGECAIALLDEIDADPTFANDAATRRRLKNAVTRSIDRPLTPGERAFVNSLFRYKTLSGKTRAAPKSPPQGSS